MQFSEIWLRTWVDPPLSTEALAHAMTMAGLEVENVQAVAPPFEHVIVAQVIEISPHPNADRLKVCKLAVSERENLTVVCGAPNVILGMKAPCALVGAQLPGIQIKKAQVRGVESSGMLCSVRELGLSDDSSGLMVLPEAAPVGADLREVLHLDDNIFTLKLTPNRADCLGVLGIAREVAAITGAFFSTQSIKPIAAVIPDTHPVSLTDVRSCARFAGRIIREVDAKKPTPQWMKERLERSGLRSVSALVDVTNYVMLELGRPLHVYDLAKLNGDLSVRWAKPGESLTLLNGQTVELTDDVVAIADQSGVIGLGGIMGGASTAVSLETQDVFLEAAWFAPEAIAGRGRRYGLVSDACHRFERGVDFANNLEGIERATQLILATCGGQPGPATDVQLAQPERSPVIVRVSRINRLLGITLSADEVSSIFNRLSLSYTRQGNDFAVVAPTYRFDLAIEEDFIEEVARLYGYEKIPVQAAQAQLLALPQPETNRPLIELKKLLAARDYQEIVTYSFVSDRWESALAGDEQLRIRVENPIANQFNVMRSTLWGGLLDCLKQNLHHRAERVRIFEVGRCFYQQAQEFVQPRRIGGLAYGSIVKEQWGSKKRNVDYFDVKGDLELLFAPHSLRTQKDTHPALHPGRSARIYHNDQAIGWLGELHPQWQPLFELSGPLPVLFELDLEPLLKRALPQAMPVSKLPSVRRDIAIVIDESLPAQAVLDVINAHCPPIVTSFELFDVYSGTGLPQGKKSLAILVLMQHTERTLTDNEVETAMQSLIAVLQQKFDARLR